MIYRVILSSAIPATLSDLTNKSRRKAMSSQCKNSSLSVALVLTVVFGLFVSGAPSAVLAAPLSKKVCTEEDVYDRMECKQNGLVDQLGQMVDENLTSRAIGLTLSESKKKLMKSENEKVKVIKEHVKTDNFKNLVKGIRKNNKKSCELVPLTEVAGHINGICEPDLGELCAAEDLTSECDPKLKRPHPNKPGLVCAQICETEAAQTDQDEEEELQLVALELEASYDALEDSLIETNEELYTVNSILESEAVELKMSSDDSCANIEPLPEGLEESLTGLRIAAEAAAAVHEGVVAFSRQTIVAVAVAAGFGGGGGGNTSLASEVTAVIAGVAQMAYVIVDEIVSEKQAELEKNTFSCLQKAVLDIATVEGKTDALSDQIEQLREELVNLLNTPQGRRDEFPIQ